nr:peptidoglycan bridge formation glycyltransferase FemA/FemB family protein [Anaerolineae bacterium]
MQLHALTIKDRDTWNATLALLPYAHVLQTWEWGTFKSETTGWQPQRIAFMHQNTAVAMAQILTRQEGPFRIMYVPKGPVLDYTNEALRKEVIAAIKRYAHDRRTIFIKIDPDVVIGTGIPGTPGASTDNLGLQLQQEWEQSGFRFSPDQVQFRNSQIIDLRQTEEAILLDMKQKTRYNVRLGPRRDITIRFGDINDLDALFALYKETAQRDDFVIRPLAYYRKAWADFMKAGLAQAIIAEFRGQPIAHVIIFGFGKRAWYFYGASSNDERHRMPTYALQWEAIRWAKRQGMTVYDFWGAPENFDDENDPLAGVFRFKEGFGGTVVRRIGAWDYPASKAGYALYTKVMPLLISVMQFAARRRLHSSEQSRQ